MHCTPHLRCRHFVERYDSWEALEKSVFIVCYFCLSKVYLSLPFVVILTFQFYCVFDKISKCPSDCNIPGQEAAEHCLFSTLAPVHQLPPLSGGGLVQVRVRSWVPCPHDALQPLQLVQEDQPPSTVERNGSQVEGPITSKIHIYYHCHVPLSKLNIKFAKTWTLFSNNVNTTIRKYFAPLDFVGQRVFWGVYWNSPLAVKKTTECSAQTWTRFQVTRTTVTRCAQTILPTMGHRWVGAGAGACLGAITTGRATFGPVLPWGPTTVNCGKE